MLVQMVLLLWSLMYDEESCPGNLSEIYIKFSTLQQVLVIVLKFSNITIAPRFVRNCAWQCNYMMFRTSFRMVEEILDTRVMVKKAMKEQKNDKVYINFLIQ